LEKFVLASHGAEIEWFSGREDNNLFRKIAIMRIVQTIY